MAKRRAHNPYDRYRAQAWDAVYARRGRDMTLSEVVTEVMALASVTDINALKWSSAAAAVDAEDKVRTAPAPFAVQPTLPGWPDPADQFWKLGDGQRVRVRDATSGDHLQHVQFAEANFRAVDDAMRETRASYYRLVPYYMAGASTVEAAVAAWERDQARSAGAVVVASTSRPRT